MRVNLIGAAALAALLVGAGVAPAQGKQEEKEKKIKLQDLPPAVQQAVKEQSTGARLRGLTQETENGKTFYEAARPSMRPTSRRASRGPKSKSK